MQLHEALQIGQQLILALAPHCERIEIAGSVRREKPDVKDLELVHISRDGYFENGTTLFPMPGKQIDMGIVDLVANGVLSWDRVTPRNGPKYKRLFHLATGLIVELFAAQPSTWGYIFALRTGPAEFNQMLVTPPWKGGVKPLSLSFVDGVVYKGGRPVNVPDEATFFQLFDLPLLPPPQRSATALLQLQRGEYR